MLRFLVASLYLVHIVSGEDTCSGNLVQALQQCAGAIKNNDPLSVQQEKCSPNGCNYDCPSSNKFDSIDSQISDLSALLQQVMMKQEATISDAIATNATIQSNNDMIKMKFEEAAITTNASINNLQNSIDVVKTRQNTLQDAVANNTDDIDALKDNFRVLCGSTGWTRVAYLDMTHPSESCPSAFSEINENGVRACRRKYSNGGSCNSLTFSTHALSYSEVCGRVVGYQYRTTDGLYVESENINTYYVDGISITRGSPRQHVWTLVGGLSEARTDKNSCPCNEGGTVNVPSFIGNDYFCESGNPDVFGNYQLFADDPLWDGLSCGGLEGGCCNATSLPWFHKVLDTPTTDYLELRICGSYLTTDEDTPVSLYEIFVK